MFVDRGVLGECGQEKKGPYGKHAARQRGISKRGLFKRLLEPKQKLGRGTQTNLGRLVDVT